MPRVFPYAFLYAISAGLTSWPPPKRTAPAYHDGEQEPAGTGSAAIIAAHSPLPAPSRHGFTLTGSARPPRPRPGSSSRSAREISRGPARAGKSRIGRRDRADRPGGGEQRESERGWRPLHLERTGGGGCAGIAKTPTPEWCERLRPDRAYRLNSANGSTSANGLCERSFRADASTLERDAGVKPNSTRNARISFDAFVAIARLGF